MLTLTEQLDSHFRAHRIATAFNHDLVARYGCNWITLNSDREGGGTPICIGDNGRIDKGPKGLMRRSIKSLTAGPTKREQAIREGAQRHKVDKVELAARVEEVWHHERMVHAEREDFKKMARGMSGMTQASISRAENSYLDYSSSKRLDEVADELHNNNPGMLDPDDPTASLWELLREGKVDAPAWHDQRIIDQAAELITSAMTEGDSFEFGANVDTEGF